MRRQGARSDGPRVSKTTYRELERQGIDPLAQLDAERDEEIDELVPHQRREPKIGRNAPCPCGSGKKYKRCCGRR